MILLQGYVTNTEFEKQMCGIAPASLYCFVPSHMQCSDYKKVVLHIYHDYILLLTMKLLTPDIESTVCATEITFFFIINYSYVAPFRFLPT